MQKILRDLKNRRNTDRAARQIRQSELFDDQYYRASLADTHVLQGSLIEHYIRTGSANQKNPHPLFDTTYYLSRYPDVADCQQNAFAHFVSDGAAEERNPHPLFDVGFYLRANGNLNLHGKNPLWHYLHIGALAGLNPHPCFNTSFYVYGNPDVAASALNPLVHYICFGAKEGRSPHPLFDPAYYLAQVGTASNAVANPLIHYLDVGARELLNPSPLFDTRYYLSQNADVAASGINPLIHYLFFGEKEGRTARPKLDYSKCHVSLQNADTKKREQPTPRSKVYSQLHSTSTSRQGVAPDQLLTNHVVETTERRLPPISLVLATNKPASPAINSITECLQVLPKSGFELVVIDRSQAGEACRDYQVLAAQYDNVQIQHIANIRPGAARNIGAVKAAHPVILFSGDDVHITSPDFVSAHARIHSLHPEKSFAATGSVAYPEKTRTSSRNQNSHPMQLPSTKKSTRSTARYQRACYQANLSVKSSRIGS